MRSILLLSVFTCATLLDTFAQKSVPSDVVIIPVVVHVMYNNPDQNISKEQIQSQITVLNNDYRKKNRDASNIPASFRSVAADAKIEFRLATIDPSGLSTEGIVRKNTAVASFGRDDKIKSSLTGGDDAWDRDKYLNIWTGKLEDGILGYASSPGGAAAKDGVVISFNVFGTTPNVRAPYNKGRTAVHETGHWLGLKHLWGDTPCGDDHIDDTPPQQGPTRGCPSGVVVTCTAGTTGNMYMNFMDFTNDDCTNMFTQGQVNKMHELFQEGGARFALLSSTAAAGAEFDQNAELAISGISVYPNPVADQLNIRFNETAGSNGKQLIIYNHLGQITKQVTINKNLMQVDIRDLKNGLYFISTGNKKIHKFIKAG